MRIAQIGQLVFGAFTIYAVMAACGGSDSAEKHAKTDGQAGTKAGGAGGNGGAPGGGSGGIVLADATNENPVDGTDGPASGGIDSSAVGDASDASILDAITDPVPDALADVSGTRLKGKYLLGADGSKMYERGVWFDSQRNEDCTYELAADSKTRCLPKGLTDHFYVYYADGNCTKMLAAFPPPPSGCQPDPAPKYLRFHDPKPYCATDSTVLPMHVFPLVGTATPVTTYFKKDPSCQPASQAPPPTWLLYEYAAEVAVSNFIDASNGIDP